MKFQVCIAFPCDVYIPGHISPFLVLFQITSMLASIHLLIKGVTLYVPTRSDIVICLYRPPHTISRHVVAETQRSNWQSNCLAAGQPSVPPLQTTFLVSRQPSLAWYVTRRHNQTWRVFPRRLTTNSLNHQTLIPEIPNPHQ